MILDRDIAEWLDTFALAVRQRDYKTAEGLFAMSVIAFGTHAIIAENLAALISEQWARTWPHTTGFRFRQTAIRQDGHTAVVLARWSTDEPKRAGRCTLVFKEAEKRLLCTHSHFSLNPTPEFG